MRHLADFARFARFASLALWGKAVAGVCALGCAWALLLQPAAAQDLQPVPALSARVIDQTSTLSADQAAALEARLAAFERERGSQVVVLVVRTTLPEDIAAYAQRVASDWKIGRAEVGDGLLLVVALDDRRIRIEVARALEGAVPDVLAGRIIREVMTPAFRQGDFAGGITAGVDRILRLIEGEALPPPPASGSTGASGASGEPGFDGYELALFALFALPIVGAVARAIAGRKLGSVLTGGAGGWLAQTVTGSWLMGLGVGMAALLAVWVMGSRSLAQAVQAGRGSRSGHGGWGGGFGGGGGGFGGGGGGFSSGGGGGFGGGGASGGW